MYLSIRRYQLDPNVIGDVMRIAREGYLPRVHNDPGFVAYYVFQTDAQSVATVAVFESREQMEQSSRSAAAWVQEHLAPFFPNPPEVISGQVGAYAHKGWRAGSEL